MMVGIDDMAAVVDLGLAYSFPVEIDFRSIKLGSIYGAIGECYFY
jgi:hypothetical protein